MGGAVASKKTTEKQSGAKRVGKTRAAARKKGSRGDAPVAAGAHGASMGADATPAAAPVTVMRMGFEGGSVHVTHDPESGDFWLRVSQMSLAFWGLDDEDDENNGGPRPPEGTKGLQWDEVRRRLHDMSWWRLQPMEVNPAFARRLRFELEKLQLSGGWQNWLDNDRARRTKDDLDGPRVEPKRPARRKTSKKSATTRRRT